MIAERRSVVHTSPHMTAAACADKGTARCCCSGGLRTVSQSVYLRRKRSRHGCTNCQRPPLEAHSALRSRRPHGSRLP